MGDWTPTRSGSRRCSSQAPPTTIVAAVPVLPGVAAGGRVVEALGDPAEWIIEWKWDGIRAQLVRRGGAVHLWSRGEELITHRFPEIAAAATHLPDGTVLDGEVLAFRDDRPLPFSALQQRIGRQKQVAQMVRTVPVVFMTYDLLEDHGEDIRGGRSPSDGRYGGPAEAGRYVRRSAGRSTSRTRRPPRRRSACRLSSPRRRGTSSRSCAPDRGRAAWKG